MNQKILVIDGHPVYIKKTEGFLRGLTLQNITLAKTGEEGLIRFKADAPDLVILSGMLPDTSSVDVCAVIKEHNPRIVVIVQTGLFTSDETIKNFKACGADFILERQEKDLKPLQDAVEDFLCKSSRA